ncbi:hypothetical protein IPA_01035 [Ignicoccus pacificus DSM 13166]|uniref:Uncharacterized protein n=1 Tax=Ignicoccus pacificus DSM 13166 TaxID=940294 RepID=A0A977PJS4_9CREN|nr:hypothetical protein IPA_01035 [Ignicoccus pacificus DSM 13166]
MRFVARVFPSKEKVVIVREDGKVKTVSKYLWETYLSKCNTYGFAYLCRRSVILTYGKLAIGIVTNREPLLEDLEELKPLLEQVGMPDFVYDEAVSLIYARDTLLDLSCAGCNAIKSLPEVTA